MEKKSRGRNSLLFRAEVMNEMWRMRREIKEEL